MLNNKTVILVTNVASSMLIFRKQLIHDLVEKGYTVYCVAYGYAQKDKETIKNWGAIAYDSPLNPKGLNPFSDLKAMFGLKQLFIKLSPDVVFSFSVKPVVFGSLASKLAKVPRTVSMIEGLGNAFIEYPDKAPLKNRLIRLIQVFLYRISLPKVDQLIVLNPDDKKDLIDRYNLKVKKLDIVLGIGVNLDELKPTPVPCGQISFIFVARLLKEKGIMDYILAAEIVKKSYPNTPFIVIGEFDNSNPFAADKKELEQSFSDKGITYFGYVDNVGDYLSNSSVFVLPSYYREGLPRSTQEAMAIGRAVITTDVPGCRETVIDGENGFVVPVASPHQLAEKMKYFIENPSEAKRMGMASHKIAKDKFDVQKINQQLIALING